MMLGPGATGGAVADLQRRLAAMGFAPGPVDGVFGPQTHAALQRFQQSHGLAADGIDGPLTEQAFAAVQAPVGGPVGPPPAPTQKLSPMNDPAYLQFHRAAVADEGQARAYTAMKQSMLQQAFEDQVPSINLRGQGERDKIAGDFSDKGMWNSGGRVNQMAQSVASQQADITRIQNDAGRQKNDLQAQLENHIADLRMQDADRYTQAAGQVSTDIAKQGGDVSATPSPQAAPVRLS